MKALLIISLLALTACKSSPNVDIEIPPEQSDPDHDNEQEGPIYEEDDEDNNPEPEDDPIDEPVEPEFDYEAEALAEGWKPQEDYEGNPGGRTFYIHNQRRTVRRDELTFMMRKYNDLYKSKEIGMITGQKISRQFNDDLGLQKVPVKEE